MNVTQLFDVLKTRVRHRQILIFMAIYECKNIVAAAKQVSLSQSTLSKSLAEMENMLSCKLFIRLPRGVRPTAAGDVLYRYAKLLMNQHKLAAEELAHLSSADRGLMILGCGHVWDLVIARALSLFKSQYPGTTVRIIYTADVELINGLLKADYDLIFGRLFPEGKNQALIQETVYYDPNRMLVRNDHPATQIADPKLIDLMDYPWLLPLPNALIRRQFDQLFFDLGLSLPKNIIECSSMLTARSMLKEMENVITIPPASIFRKEVDAGEFVELKVEALDTHIPVGFTQRKGSTLTKPIIAFQESVRQVLNH